jgi:hypothetical protein
MPLPSSLTEYGSAVNTQLNSTVSRLNTQVNQVSTNLSSQVNALFNKNTGSSSGSTSATPASGSLTSPVTTSNGIAADNQDLRIKLSLPALAPNIFYKDNSNNLLAPLRSTGGFIFPIQPQMTLGFEASYQESAPTHSNFPYYHYTNSKISPITLTGEFPVRTRGDAAYVQAGIQFLRSCTRMFNYADGQYGGAPPVVLRLTGMGFSGFDNIPVVLANCTVSYTDGVDFVSFKPFGGSELAKMPVLVNIQITLNPVFSRDFITNNYSTLGFSRGDVRLLGRQSVVPATSTAAAGTDAALPAPDFGINTPAAQTPGSLFNPASASFPPPPLAQSFNSDSINNMLATPPPAPALIDTPIPQNNPVYNQQYGVTLQGATAVTVA